MSFQSCGYRHVSGVNLFATGSGSEGGRVVVLQIDGGG